MTIIKTIHTNPRGNDLTESSVSPHLVLCIAATDVLHQDTAVTICMSPLSSTSLPEHFL